MPKSEISITVNPVADRASNEKIIEFSSPAGGGLISFRITQDDQLSVHVYRQDLSVCVTAGVEDQPVRHGNMRADQALYEAAKSFTASWEASHPQPGSIHHEEDADPAEGGILLTRNQVSSWAGLGRDLTDDELDRLADCIPNSSIPDAISTITCEAMSLTRSDDPDELEDETI